MNIRQLAERLLNKWPAKVICLVLAILFYIFHQVSMIEKKVYVVPLEIVQEGNVMLLGDCPSSVSVIVRTNAEMINTIVNTDLKARINLNNLEESGSFTVPVEFSLSDKLLVYDPLEVRVKPENITLSVGKKVAKYVPIVPSISGKVAEGYEITELTVNPSSVAIIGPESIVQKITEVQTDALIVNNAEKNFSDEINYLEVNKLISVENKGPYRATVTVEPMPMKRDFTGIHIVLRNLPETLEVVEEIPDIDFTLSGTVPILSKYILGVNAVQLDLSTITEPGIYNVPVKFALPGNVFLESKSFESVSVNVGVRTDNAANSETAENNQ